MNSLYPVGSIYLGTQSTCPLAALIPNSTWELIAADRVLQGAGSNHAAGTTIEAGLPNITGAVNGGAGDWTSHTANGAFRAKTKSGEIGSSGTAISKYMLELNAAWSSTIYGNSSTVQPPAYVVNIWKRTA